MPEDSSLLTPQGCTGSGSARTRIVRKNRRSVTAYYGNTCRADRGGEVFHLGASSDTELRLRVNYLIMANESGKDSADNRSIFQKIIDGDISADRVYEDEHFLAFKDIQPKAPVHFLVVPKKHSPRLDEMLDAQGKEDVGALFEAAVRAARANDVKDYRLVVNLGAGAGQEVFHTHVHVLSYDGKAREVG